ncbi:LOW QUALITY PROTEIN: hypothetical protein RJ640_025926, partial [Escallonia rubra]
MAADIGVAARSKRKRKRTQVGHNRKLLEGHKVEVRSTEEGFLGSWHSGTVIACEHEIRVVQYDHLLCDDDLEKLVDRVVVSPVIEGIILTNWPPSNYRGVIRPLPPKSGFSRWCLCYGQCVDVFYNDAWWEGVIFDHEKASEERIIFFPDLGDQMKVQIEMLRITLDWDEKNEDWQPRGNWLFLELIEEFKQEWPLIVSVEQIWYEVRSKSSFVNLKEWTTHLRDIWKELVILDNVKLTLRKFFHKLTSSGNLALDSWPSFELSEPALDALLKAQACSGDSLAIVPFESTCRLDKVEPTNLKRTRTQQFREEIGFDDLTSVVDDARLDMKLSTTSIMPSDEEALCMLPPASSAIPSHQSEPWMISKSSHEGFPRVTSKMPTGSTKRSKIKKRHVWLPAGIDIVPRAEFCPDAVTQYEKKSGSLDGLVTKILKKSVSEALALTPQDDQTSLAAAPDSPFSSPPTEPPQVCKEAPAGLSPTDVVVIGPEYCPQAIADYCSIDARAWRRDATLKDLQLKAKKHLASLGWSFYYIWRNDKRELRYSSPSKKVYHSLKVACKHCIDEEPGFSHHNAYALKQRRNTNVIEETEGQLVSEPQFSSLLDLEVDGTLVTQNSLSEKRRKEPFSLPQSRHLAGLGKVRKLRKERHSQLSKKGKKSGALVKPSDNPSGHSSARVLRSSKRARIASSPHHTPRTVLSWLIDNNVVLPRAKVHYRGRKNGCTMAEGRVTREGIKCSCCQDVFTLSKFESHAGSCNHRPAANIFLEDGRSLLECQLQLKHDLNARNSRTKPCKVNSNRYNSKNDYICSICHYGGELVLCDQCPSSFHTSCLGLKEVPDGDWFCPSCCCRICGERRLSKNSELSLDNRILTCYQCEHQYHVGCLKEKGITVLDSFASGNWFCNKSCTQVSSSSFIGEVQEKKDKEHQYKIYLGLSKLLGKPVSVGFDNLTWTLLKHIKSNGCEHYATDIEDVTENYSKLNVALGVMHECFEPVKEPRTRRDLVEDVIFGSWSELNRLNFQGFYTVLLERNDELISVATVRVYGDKVAEVPLVGTRFQYRRLGMCRVLMNELEKKLMELGVERLVLPAIPSVLHTWTTSFGFSKMTESERLNFLAYTFLDFQGTIMCQKHLTKIPYTESGPSRRFPPQLPPSPFGEIALYAFHVRQPTDLECIPRWSKINRECLADTATCNEGENDETVVLPQQ